MKKTLGNIVLAGIICFINILLMFYTGIMADEFQVNFHISHMFIMVGNILLYIILCIAFMLQVKREARK